MNELHYDNGAQTLGLDDGVEGTGGESRESGSGSPHDLGGKLEIMRPIGTGGMGVVYEVHHNVLGVRRAVKLLVGDFVGRSERVMERFRREALVASELSHPNIIKVYDLDRAPDGTPFILMELLEGRDLESLIRTGAPFELEKVVSLLAGPADALDAVHRNGVVHRDLKPANLFLTQKGTVKVLDFGITQLAKDVDARITRAGEVLGTPLYMSPEQMMGEHVDGRADVYALAAIAYELLTGKTIFEPTTVNQVSAAVLLEDPVAPSVIDDELPEHVDGVFARVFSKAPSKRHRTCLEFLRDLAGPAHRGLISAVLRSEIASVMDSASFDIDSDSAQGSGTGDRLSSNAELLSQGIDVDTGRRSHGMALKVGGAALLVALLLFLGVAVLKVTQAPSATVEIRQVTVEGEEDAEWTAAAARDLMTAYLRSDDVVNPAVGSSLNSSANPSAAGALHRVDLALQRQEDGWRVTAELFASSGNEPVWSVSSRSSGYDRALEEISWRLHEHVDERVWKLGSPAPEEKARRLSDLSKAAIVEQGLLYRVGRMAAAMGDSPYRVFWESLGEYLSCASGQPAWKCLADDPFPAVVEVSDPSVVLVWKALAEGSRDGGRLDCSIFASEDPFVDAVGTLLPWRSECVELEDGICGEMETFWDRYRCALDSSSVDKESTSLEYLFVGLERDGGNALYGNVDVLFMNGISSEKGEAWFRRMAWRYGTDEPTLAGLFFALAMGRRDSSDALIWARRSTSSLPKVGLALQMSGWLKEGIRKHSEAAAERMLKSRGDLDQGDTRLLRDSIQPVLVTGEPMLARQWLEAIAEAGEGETLEAARNLVRAISEGDKVDVCGAEAGGVLELETDYFCERYERILGSVSVTADDLNCRSPAGFYFADSLARVGRDGEAKEIFEVIERDPVCRVSQPLASTVSMQRLGDISERRGDAEEALRRYREFLTTWESLDTPIDEYFRVTEKVNSERLQQ